MNTELSKQFPEMTMYVLVRGDLSGTYRMTQGAHAIVEYALEHTDMFTRWDNGRIVFLGVFGLRDLKDWLINIAKRNIVLSIYKEPDLEDQYTAIACIALENEYDVFKGLSRA